MAEFTAKDVQTLRQSTGAGMMDAKKALEANDGDAGAAAKWLRERGLGKAADRADRASGEGAVAVATAAVNAGGGAEPTMAAALVALQSETDFVAKSPPFVALADDLARLVAEKGAEAVAERQVAIEDLRITSKENIELGRVVRFEAGPGNALDTYLHVQNGRGVNGILVEVAGADRSVAHEIAVHIAFGRPGVVSRDEVPVADIAAEREALTNQTRNEGKPEQALTKIVEGKLNGWFKRVPGGVLLEQPFARDDHLSVQAVLGTATVVRFAQVVVGG